MGRSISPMEEEPVAGSDPSAAPRLIVPMSLQLVIPRRVALQQSSPALHQPSVSLKEKRKFEKEEPLNCRCANSKLSQQKGSPQHLTSGQRKVRHATLPNRTKAGPASIHDFLQGIPRGTGRDQGSVKVNCC